MKWLVLYVAFTFWLLFPLSIEFQGPKSFLLLPFDLLLLLFHRNPRHIHTPFAYTPGVYYLLIWSPDLSRLWLLTKLLGFEAMPGLTSVPGKHKGDIYLKTDACSLPFSKLASVLSLQLHYVSWRGVHAQLGKHDQERRARLLAEKHICLYALVCITGVSWIVKSWHLKCVFAGLVTCRFFLSL